MRLPSLAACVWPNAWHIAGVTVAAKARLCNCLSPVLSKQGTASVAALPLLVLVLLLFFFLLLVLLLLPCFSETQHLPP
jgi:hypothetical protein